MAASCHSEPTDVYNGYVEGEYVYISAYTGGILDQIDVVKGQPVEQGTGLFRLDEEIWAADLARAQSVLDKAQANLSNLSKGKRRQELEVILKQKAQAQAVLDNARKEYARAQELIKTRHISRSDYDKKRSDFYNARAKTEELDASFQTATLAAREDELAAARKEIEAAAQELKKYKNKRRITRLFLRFPGGCRTFISAGANLCRPGLRSCRFYRRKMSKYAFTCRKTFSRGSGKERKSLFIATAVRPAAFRRRYLLFLRKANLRRR